MATDSYAHFNMVHAYLHPSINPQITATTANTRSTKHITNNPNFNIQHDTRALPPVSLSIGVPSSKCENYIVSAGTVVLCFRPRSRKKRSPLAQSCVPHWSWYGGLLVVPSCALSTVVVELWAMAPSLSRSSVAAKSMLWQ